MITRTRANVYFLEGKHKEALDAYLALVDHEEDPIAAEWEVKPATETAETAPAQTEIAPETTESAPVEEAADPQNEDHGQESSF